MLDAYDKATPKARAISTYKALVDLGMINKFNSGDDFASRALAWSKENKLIVSKYLGGNLNA